MYLCRICSDADVLGNLVLQLGDEIKNVCSRGSQILQIEAEIDRANARNVVACIVVADCAYSAKTLARNKGSGASTNANA